MEGNDVVNDVKEYYGKILKTKEDLKTNACCTGDSMPRYLRQILKDIHTDVTNKYYGCGLNLPDGIEGSHILDLGSGSGRDCFLLSKLVGENGFVTGIDMTDEQLDVARRYIDYHRDKFNFAKANTEFKKGYIENLQEAGIDSKSVDVIISNCVINLSPNKQAVLKEAYRVLKIGGEMYFSDVYCDKQLSPDIVNNKMLWGECLGGALYWQDFYDITRQLGFLQPLIVSVSPIYPKNNEIANLLGDAKFVSVTYRVFKVPSCYRTTKKVRATYKGSIETFPDVLSFTNNTSFKANESVEIPTFLGDILRKSRYNQHFELVSLDGENEGIQGVHQEPAIIDPFELLNGQVQASCYSTNKSSNDCSSSRSCSSNQNNASSCY